MSENREIKNFPTISAKHWWSLRERFQNTMPKSKVTGDYLSLVLSTDGSIMTAKSANDNVLRHLRRMGLVLEDGTVNEELARMWRSDEGYSAACQIMLETVYPTELLDALPPPNPDLSAAQSWFMRTAGVGMQAARKMASTYGLLAEADVSGQSTKKTASPTKAEKRSPSPNKSRDKPLGQGLSLTELEPESDVMSSDRGSVLTKSRVEPAVHVNVQVHISAESTAEQIDQIFASMRKYLLQEVEVGG